MTGATWSDLDGSLFESEHGIEVVAVPRAKGFNESETREEFITDIEQVAIPNSYQKSYHYLSCKATSAQRYLTSP